MPTYVYQVVRPDGSLDETSTFEVVQSMRDEPLSIHPESGKPVRRVILPPMVAGDHTDSATRKKLGDRNLEKLGFTKYVRSDSGGMDKAFGGGPQSIKD